MLKKISSLKGSQILSKAEQKSIKGGKAPACCLRWKPIERECTLWDYNCLNG
ncbi:hypothetical protein [Flavobacterium sp. '19STA2R22 D10 B1']|uniref:hypothetical protein n=1 Tax=Flavobacterium aerium TaxID=3037261 RepID=UPI00278BDAA3|nr:hypothetical protein [Flavobacterium sp. '19STA2R22 D10 B1']